MEESFKPEGFGFKSLDEAITFFENAKRNQFFKDPELAYFNLAQAYLLKGHLKQAREELQKGLERFPKNPTLQNLLDWVEVSYH